MKKYVVKFTETYTYVKLIEINDDENIDDVIRCPLECPRIADITPEEYEKLNAECLNEYEY